MKILFVKSEENTKENEISNLLSELLQREKKSEVILFNLPKKSFFNFFSSVFTLRKIIKSQNINIVHSFNLFGGIIAFFSFTRIKKVVSFVEDFRTIKPQKKLGLKKLSIFLNRRIRKIVARYLFDVTIVNSQRQVNQLIKNGNYQVMPTFIAPDKFYQKNQLLTSSETHILYVGNSELDEQNFKIVDAAVTQLGNWKIKLTPLNYKISNKEKNDLYNSANIIITSLNPSTIEKITTEILLTNSKIISLENNYYLRSFSEISNLYFCSNDSTKFLEEIKKVIVAPTLNSRNEVIFKNENEILNKLIYIYKMNYIWKN